jgi:hypothetical protein
VRIRRHHIEQGSRRISIIARHDYQPKEHVLELTSARLRTARSVSADERQAVRVVYPDFSVIPGRRRSADAKSGGHPARQKSPDGWKSGGPNCVTVLNWQVQAYNEDFSCASRVRQRREAVFI